MHLLSGGRLKMAASVYYASAAASETFEMPVSCALLMHTQGNALFDTGCHPDAATDPAGRWGGNALHSPPIFRREEAVVGQLVLAGLTPEDIDLVICSHLHYDHCGCNGFFSRATVLCHADELRAAMGPDPEPAGYHRDDWDVGLPTTTITGHHDVFGDGRLTLIPMPGHTPGSLAGHVVLERMGAFLLASDAAPVSETLSKRFVPLNSVDPDLFLSSLDDVDRISRDGATVIFGHDNEQWQRIPKGSFCYR